LRRSKFYSKYPTENETVSIYSKISYNCSAKQ
jgi:hypothetical protein